MKKAGISLASLLLLALMLASLASAAKLDVIPTQESFAAGESITIKTSLFDDSNMPIDAGISVVIEDAERRVTIGKTVPSNSLSDIVLGEGAPSGYWKITAKYSPENGEETVSTALFMVDLNELARFEIKDSILTVINAGNTQYAKTIQIVIGDTIGSKIIDLGLGESVSFRLVAPQGTYNIKVTDGKTTLTKSNVALTGNVIGVLDNREISAGPITGGVTPSQDSPYGDDILAGTVRNKGLVYTFLLVVFGAGILLAIERNMRKKALSPDKPMKAA